MPKRCGRPCSKAGCPKVVDGKYCDEHQQHKSSSRRTSTQRGYGYRWQKARKVYLSHHPLCKHCQDKGIITAANVVDHIKPHQNDQRLMWDELNWQPLCKPCHDIKTATEDGGFGRWTLFMSLFRLSAAKKAIKRWLSSMMATMNGAYMWGIQVDLSGLVR